MKFRIVLLFVMIGVILVVTAAAQDVDISFDKRVDFSKYQTYAWGTGTPAPNPLTDQRIIAGIEERLAKIGWRKVAEDPDVLVIYNVSVQPETKIKSYAAGGPYAGYQWGLYGYGGWVAGGTIGEGIPVDKIETLQVGQLVVDMADARTKNFMWRGSANETLKDTQPDKIHKKVKSAISKLFKNFPPKPKN